MGTASFTWLDHREDDAQRVREALKALDEPGMLDPLGFGVIRDAFSEMLFPGISTVQTRARYFLLVPWVYHRLDAERITSSEAAAVARAWELDLIDALCEGSADRAGVIGQESRRGTVQLPSQIYWGGLGRWGIRLFRGTRRDYVAGLDQRRRTEARSEQNGALWHDGLPGPPDDLFVSSNLALTEPESDFLRTRILRTVGDTYLGALTLDGRPHLLGDHPWDGPVADAAEGDQARQLRHARYFSLVSWGANLRYNVLLHDRYLVDGDDGLGDRAAVQLADWVTAMEAEGPELRAWGAERADFWSIVRSQHPRTEGPGGFVDLWLDAATASPAGAAESSEVGRLLVNRELAIKHQRARLSYRRARETTKGPQGDSRMSFRWSYVCQILGDILGGDA